MLSEQDFAAWPNGSIFPMTRNPPLHRFDAPIRRAAWAAAVKRNRPLSQQEDGVTIQFESHRVELPAIFELEYDDSVLEYYDQAPSIKLDYRSVDGKRLGVLHTPTSS